MSASVIARNALAQEESEEFSGDFSDPIDIHLDRESDGCACWWYPSLFSLCQERLLFTYHIHSALKNHRLQFTIDGGWHIPSRSKHDARLGFWESEVTCVIWNCLVGVYTNSIHEYLVWLIQLLANQYPVSRIRLAIPCFNSNEEDERLSWTSCIPCEDGNGSTLIEVQDTEGLRQWY